MSRFTGLLLGALLALVPFSSAALEIGVTGMASNLFFPWTEKDATAPGTSAFPATNYFWGGEAWMSTPIGMDGLIRVSYLRDPVLRNLVSGTVEFERGVAKISVGPLVGLFNSTAVPFSAGLTTKVELRWPGVAYVSVQSEGGLAIGVLQMTEDPQALTELSAGFYVPNAIVSGQLTVKRFNDEVGGSLVTDTATRYALVMDIFKKNVPYTLLATVGYELRNKLFAVSGEADGLGSVVLGAKVSARVARGYTVSADLESAFYTFGMDNLSNRGPNASSFMFSAGLGLVIDVDALRSLEPVPETAEPDATAAPAATTAAPAGTAAAPATTAPSPAPGDTGTTSGPPGAAPGAADGSGPAVPPPSTP